MSAPVSIMSMFRGCLPALESAMNDSESNGVDDCIVIGDFFGFGSDIQKIVKTVARAKHCLSTEVDRLICNESLQIKEIPISNTIQQRILMWTNAQIQKDPGLYSELCDDKLPFCDSDILFCSRLAGLMEIQESNIRESFKKLNGEQSILVSLIPFKPCCIDSSGVVIEDPLAIGKIERKPDRKYLISPGCLFSLLGLYRTSYVTVTQDYIEFHSSTYELKDNWTPFFEMGVLNKKDLSLLKKFELYSSQGCS